MGGVNKGELDGGNGVVEAGRAGEGVRDGDLVSEVGAYGKGGDEGELIGAAVSEEFFVGRVVRKVFHGRVDLALFEDADVICIGHEEELFLLVFARVKPDVLHADRIPPVCGGDGARRGGEQERRKERQKEEQAFHVRYRTAFARAGGELF